MWQLISSTSKLPSYLEKAAFPELWTADPAWPWPVHIVEYPLGNLQTTHSFNSLQNTQNITSTHPQTQKKICIWQKGFRVSHDRTHLILHSTSHANFCRHTKWYGLKNAKMSFGVVCIMTYCGDVAWVEVGRLLQEGQACVRVHHILNNTDRRLITFTTRLGRGPED